MMKKTAYGLGTFGLVAVALVILILAHKPDETLVGTKIAPLSGPLVIDAPGCEIKGPDGKSIKEAVREQGQTQGKVVLPKGSTLNGDCFSVAKAAKAAKAAESK